MSAPLYESADAPDPQRTWVSVLTTPLFGGAWLLCVHTPRSHEIYPVPQQDVSADLVVKIAKLVLSAVKDAAP